MQQPSSYSTTGACGSNRKLPSPSPETCRMAKLDVVEAVVVPILDHYEPSNDPNLKMTERGFNIFIMDAALSDISSSLADPSVTEDGNAYKFSYDQDFILKSLGLN